MKDDFAVNARAATPWSVSELAQIRTLFAQILQSTPFIAAPQQQRLLNYLFEHRLAQTADRLKGYTIALEVYDKPADFDPSQDAIVRVEATRLRHKLREFYATEGHACPLHLALPKGSYQLDIALHTHATKPLATPTVSAEPATARAGESKPSLAVLPFVVIGLSAANSYFADGMADALISLLSRFSGLTVISRQSSFAFRDTRLGARDIGQQLGVRYLLEGSVQSADRQIRLAVQLVDVEDARLMWSERFDAQLDDVFALQDTLAADIARALQLTLAKEEAHLFNYHQTDSLVAYDDFLRGLEKFRQYQKLSTFEAERYFRQAIASDVQYASAYSFLARTLVYQYVMQWSSRSDLLDESLTLATRAVALAPHSPYSHGTLGWVYLWRKQSSMAIASCRRGLELDVNHAESLLFLSMALTSAGQGEDGLLHIQRAKRLTPYSSPVYEFALGQAFMALKRYEEAIAAFDHGIALSPTFIPNHHEKMVCLWHLGKQAEIQQALRALQALGYDFKHTPVNIIWTQAAYDADAQAIAAQIYALTDTVKPSA